MAAPNLLKPFSDFLIISTAARLPSPIPPDWRHLEPRAVVPPAALLRFAREVKNPNAPAATRAQDGTF